MNWRKITPEAVAIIVALIAFVVVCLLGRGGF